MSVALYDQCSRQRAANMKDKNKKPDDSHMKGLETLQRRVVYWLREKCSEFANAKKDLTVGTLHSRCVFRDSVLPCA